MEISTCVVLCVCVCNDGFDLKFESVFCRQEYFSDTVMNGKYLAFRSVEILDDVMFLVSAVAFKTG